MSAAEPSQPVWTATESLVRTSPLAVDTTTDVCVVGAGIAGMTTAYLLARRGRRVVVVDKESVGGGETHRTTAHLANAIDDRYCELERMLGADAARVAAESHTAAIDSIERIAGEEQIDCQFERLDGYLFRGMPEHEELLAREYDAARRTGIVVVEWVDRAPAEGLNTGRCLRFLRQGQLHPVRFLAGLARAIERQGGRIYTGTRVEAVEGGADANVQVRGGPVIRAQAVVMATNTPVNDRFVIHTKQAPYRTFVVGARVPDGSVPRALYWDTLDAYHYIRLERVGAGDAAHDVLIVGGEDHKTGHADDGHERFRRLERWSRERFPAIEAIEYRWSGQVMESFDGLAFIGRNPGDKDNVFVATGDSGMGMTHGVIAGMILTELVQGKEHPWAKVYDPTRQMTGNLAMFAQENLAVAKEYGAWLTPGEVKSAAEIAPGSGAILRRGLKKIAVYRDPIGHVIERSAICPHLQCIVVWNSTEQSWDCPCHGSRFSPEGKLLCGPANSDLPDG